MQIKLLQTERGFAQSSRMFADGEIRPFPNSHVLKMNPREVQ